MSKVEDVPPRLSNTEINKHLAPLRASCWVCKADKWELYADGEEVNHVIFTHVDGAVPSGGSFMLPAAALGCANCGTLWFLSSTKVKDLLGQRGDQ